MVKRRAAAAAEPAAVDSLLADLRGCLADPDQIRDGELDRHAMAVDASHFFLLPKAVATPRSAAEVARLLQASARHHVPLTFRSGGTSLSGQSVTDGVLVDVRRHFRGLDVLDEGGRVRVQPGVTVRQLNARLAPHGRQFGPDPASEVACTIGGVIANNSSGMACGTAENSYATLDSVVAVLPSGTVFDSGCVDADERLRAVEPALHLGLMRLRDRVRRDPAAVATIQRQFAMKNTMGYGVNAFLDFDTPSEIFAHLIVGSEGTLAFIAEATLRTVPLRPHVASTLLVFEDVFTANRAVPELVSTSAATLELMDTRSLRVGQSFPDCPAQIRDLSLRSQAALLLEYRAANGDQLAELTSAAAPILQGLPTSEPTQLSADASVRAKLWKLRKGLYAAVAGARPSGTTAMLEDIVVPIPALADTCAELTRLFDTYRYANSVIFGHAKDGNIHFMLTDRFESPDSMRRYADFTEDLVDLVLGHGGSLKAEHGTGRVMAPYVRRQYGEALYTVMVEVKRLCDPTGLLNPDVLLSEDPDLHLRDIKTTPVVEEEVDRCVECGYCEPVCPSHDLTMTPRQRITARRAIRSAELSGNPALGRLLEEQYQYPGLQTCAVDGMCQTTCPVHINTGDLVRRLRRREHGSLETAGWTQAARHWRAVTRSGAAALTTADTVPDALAPATTALNQAVRAVAGADRVPLWSSELPRGGPARRRAAPVGAPQAVYLPACVNSMFGPAAGGLGIQTSVERLFRTVGIELLVPANIDSLCCGTPWSSKGLPTGYEAMKNQVLPAVLAASQQGKLPLVTDASSCTEGFRTMLTADPTTAHLQVVDATSFTVDNVLPRLGEYLRLPSVSIHPTCSSTRLDLNGALLTLAEAVADKVHTPMEWGCCAFAGDRGLLHPELTASATAVQADEVRLAGAAAHASCNRTCELAMTRATGQPYRHVLELLVDLL